MPRLRLKPLDSYAFSVELTVRITDLNYGAHLGNDSLLSLIHEARVAFLRSHGFTEMDCGGVSLTMGDVAIIYQGQAYAGDVLRFEVSAGEPTRCGFRLFLRVTRAADGCPIALAEVGMVCFDYQSGKILALPDGVRGICTPGKIG